MNLLFSGSNLRSDPEARPERNLDGQPCCAAIAQSATNYSCSGSLFSIPRTSKAQEHEMLSALVHQLRFKSGMLFFSGRGCAAPGRRAAVPAAIASAPSAFHHQTWTNFRPWSVSSRQISSSREPYTKRLELFR